MGRAALSLLFVAVLTAPAGAEEPPPPEPPAPDVQPDSYETERTNKVLHELALTPDPAPEGKRIAKIRIVSHDVFADDEFWPTFLNVFHWKTKEDVIARELLFEAGQPWSQARIDESTRKLRDQIIFALVRIVPVRPVETDGIAADPNSVDALVFTRDLWSLRLESSFSFTGGLIDELVLTLIERNLLGRNVQAALSFELQPKTVSLGDRFVDRRLFGSRWQLSQSFDLVFSRDSGGLEGTRGGLAIGVPLWDLRPRWGFELSAAWDDTVGRQLSGRDILTYDSDTTPEDDRIPRIWNQTLLKVSLAGSRQLGNDDLIQRLGFGYTIYSSRYTPHEDTGLGPSNPLYQRFEDDVLAPSRTQLYPYLRWQMFTPTWVTFNDLAAFGLSEDVRVGPSLDLFFAAPLEAFGSDQDALNWEASAGLVLAPFIGNDRALLDLALSLKGRLQLGQVIDQGYRVRLRTASPRFVLGRVVVAADLESKVADSYRTLVALGGDNGLRGYASQAFYGFGADRLRVNLELRTPPAVLGSVHIGGVLFYDVGGVGDGPARLDIHHALGLGLRILLPQFNRFAFRFDLGFPLDSDHVTVLLTIGSTQAVPLTTLEDEKLSQ